MKVKNKNKVIADVKVCDTSWQRAFGLMFKTKITPLIFVFHSMRKPWEAALHTFFMFFPIDVLFLDDKKKVVDVKEDFRPWSTYTPKKKCMYVIELPSGKIKKKNTKIGDKLSF